MRLGSNNSSFIFTLLLLFFMDDCLFGFDSVKAGPILGLRVSFLAKKSKNLGLFSMIGLNFAFF